VMGSDKNNNAFDENWEEEKKRTVFIFSGFFFVVFPVEPAKMANDFFYLFIRKGYK
jgi:hypothetical protein